MPSVDSFDYPSNSNRNNNDGLLEEQVTEERWIGDQNTNSRAPVNGNSNDINEEDGDDDWEEWDGQSPFWVHCVAGSMAGVVEHAAVYPLDTVRTHIQVCASCLRQQQQHHQHQQQHVVLQNQQQAASTRHSLTSLLRTGTTTATTTSSASHNQLPTGMWQTIRYLMNEPTSHNVLVKSASSAARNIVVGEGSTRAASSAVSSSSSSLLPTRTATVAASRASSTLAAAAATASSSPSGHFVASPVAAHHQLQRWYMGWIRLWRGVQAVMIGCVPAHALYFSSYEVVKTATGQWAASAQQEKHPHLSSSTIKVMGTSLAGAVAVISHDIIMTPLDTMKQRMQLGHYDGVRSAFYSIVQQEGFAALYRSFSVTLATNIPYGMVMVSTNEFCKQLLHHHYNADTVVGAPVPHWQIVLASSSMGGFLASALTTPLDRIKTALQTQRLEPACLRRAGHPHEHAEANTAQQQYRPHHQWRGGVGGGFGMGGRKFRKACRSPLQYTSTASVAVNDATAAAASRAATVGPTIASPASVTHATWYEAAHTIIKTEGTAGLFRGFVPRVLSHTPAAAISWTTYEVMKQSLLSATTSTTGQPLY